MNIGEVSKKFNLPSSTIRYYEKMNLIGPIPKKANGIRDFSAENLRQIEFVKCMRSADLPIDMLVKYMELYKEGDQTLTLRRQLLIDQEKRVKQQIQELQIAYDKLLYKIQLYDQQLLEKGQNCQK